LKIKQDFLNLLKTKKDLVGNAGILPAVKRQSKLPIIKDLKTGETFQRSAERYAGKMPAFPTKILY